MRGAGALEEFFHDYPYIAKGLGAVLIGVGIVLVFHPTMLGVARILGFRAIGPTDGKSICFF